MLLWSLAIVVTVIACATLYYAAARQGVNATAGGPDPALEAHFRLQLREIGTDQDAGRLLRPEAEAARRELAREYLRVQQEAGRSAPAWDWLGRWIPLPLLAIALLAFGIYAYLGRPDLPAQPLAGRPEIAAQNLDVDEAIAMIEARLAQTPDDLRGWTLIAPAYMQLGRFADAERAYRRILELQPPTADTKADLAEALLMQNQGAVTGEPLALLQEALALDPKHIRSRFYLAGEATQAGRFEEAKQQWTELIGLAQGEEPWLPAARQGLAAAEAGENGAAPAVDEQAIRSMVEGLAARLQSEGGTLAEWTQLVRSQVVLGDTAAAQAAYDAAVAAYPNAADRSELEPLAREAGLQVRGTAP